MTARYDDDRLSAWLHDIAPTREPEHLLGTVLARTARTRRRPAWRNPERLHPMSAITSRFAPAAPIPWRLLAAAALVLIALVAGLVLVASGAFRGPAPAYGLAANGALVYSDGGDIYLRTSVSATPKAIVTGETKDDSPLISLDGTHFSFLRHLDDRNAEIWVARIDGSDLQKLDIAGTRPGWFEWSPDGRSAVVIEDSHPFRLTVASLGKAPVTAELDDAIDQPLFRPGHPSQIVFVGTAATGDRAVYLINADGSGLTKLQLSPGYRDNPTYSQDKWAYYKQMSWSPTGDRIIYANLEATSAAAAGPSWRLHLAVVDAMGNVTGDRKLEFDAATDDEFSPAWLPTGAGFVFENVDGDRHWLSLATIAADGTISARALGIEGSDALGAQISPDGRYLITKVPNAGAEPTVTLLDISSGTPQVLAVGQDVSWQRLAP